MAEAIRVTGLRDLRRALKAVEGRSAKELQVANKQAAEIVAAEARRRAPKGPHQGGGRVQPITASVRAQATSGKGIVAFGGQRSPHAPAYEFGGTLRRHASARRTRVAKRPFVYPAITSERDKVLDAYEQALGRIVRDLR